MDARASRTIAWAKAEPFGAEIAEVRLEPDRLSASGTAIGSAPLPYRIDYALETTTRFVTTRLVVTARGDGWSRGLVLRRSHEGAW